MARSLNGRLIVVVDATLRCALCGYEDGYCFESPDDFLIPLDSTYNTTWGAIVAQVEAEIADEDWRKAGTGWLCSKCARCKAKREKGSSGGREESEAAH